MRGGGLWQPLSPGQIIGGAEQGQRYTGRTRRGAAGIAGRYRALSGSAPSPVKEGPTRPVMKRFLASLKNRFLDALVRHRWVLLLLALALTAAALWPASQLSFSYDIEAMFADDDPKLLAYLETNKAFGGHQTVVIAFEDPDLFTPDKMQRLQGLADQLSTIRLGEHRPIVGIDTIAGVRRFGQATVLQELRTHPERAAEIRDDLLGQDLFRNTLLGRDGKTVAISMTVDLGGQTREGTAEMMQKIRKIMDRTNLEYHLAGGPALLEGIFSYMEEDSRTFQIFTTLLLSVVMLVLFRRWRWVVLPIAVVHITLLWTKALLWLTQSRLTIVSSMLNALITIIGIATVIHVAVRYQDARAGGQVSAWHAVQRTLRTVLPAVFWTCLTTAAGFGALTVSRIAPVQDFGTMMAVGAGLVFIVAAMILPAGMLLGKRPAVVQPTVADTSLGRGLGELGTWSARHGLLVGACWGLMLAVALVGVTRLSTLNNFTDNFRKNSPITNSYAFIEGRLSGASPMDVVVPVTAPLTRKKCEQLRRLEADLRALPHELTVIGLVDLMDYTEARVGEVVIETTTGPAARAAFKQLPGGLLVSHIRNVVQQVNAGMRKSEAFRKILDRLPGKMDRLPFRIPPQQVVMLLNQFESGIVEGYWNRRKGHMRIRVYTKERLPAAQKDQLTADTQTLLRKHYGRTPGADPDNPRQAPFLTGEYVIFRHLVSSLMEDQATTFATAAACILVMMMIAFRSVWLGLAALVPNALPIIIVLGTMGWIGLPVNIATAMIASVSMGMAVDSSIHYIYRFRRHMETGTSATEAIRLTHASVGRALVFANLAILVGFSVLCLSNFVPTIHFGILVGVAMFGGLMGNLFVLPALLRLLAYFGRIPPDPDGAEPPPSPV